jgi:hypothetical protein
MKRALIIGAELLVLVLVLTVFRPVIVSAAEAAGGFGAAEKRAYRLQVYLNRRAWVTAIISDYYDLRLKCVERRATNSPACREVEESIERLKVAREQIAEY